MGRSLVAFPGGWLVFPGLRGNPAFPDWCEECETLSDKKAPCRPRYDGKSVVVMNLPMSVGLLWKPVFEMLMFVLDFDFVVEMSIRFRFPCRRPGANVLLMPRACSQTGGCPSRRPPQPGTALSARNPKTPSAPADRPQTNAPAYLFQVPG